MADRGILWLWKNRKNVLVFIIIIIIIIIICLLFSFKEIAFKQQKSKKDAKPWANMSKEYNLFIEGIRN